MKTPSYQGFQIPRTGKIGLSLSQKTTQTAKLAIFVSYHLSPKRAFLARERDHDYNMVQTPSSRRLAMPRRGIAFKWVRVPSGIKKIRTPPRAFGFFGAREGTRTPTGLPHAPQTCLSTIPTLSQVLGYCILFSLFCQSFFTGWDGRFSR